MTHRSHQNLAGEAPGVLLILRYLRYLLFKSGLGTEETKGTKVGSSGRGVSGPSEVHEAAESERAESERLEGYALDE